MIVVQSHNGDHSTDEVIEWLIYYRINFIRLNDEDSITIVNSTICDNKIEFKFKVNNGEVISSLDISGYWHRRGTIVLNKWEKRHVENLNLSTEHKSKIIKNIDTEIFVSRDFLMYLLQQVSTKIGDPSNSENNKLIHLSIAKKIGLDIPPSKICTQKAEVLMFYRTHGKIILKPISYVFQIYDEISLHCLYTNVITVNEINKFPVSFLPSFFQKKIEKKVEIRIFFLQGNVYPMAIFSQNDSMTSVDFRRYNKKVPNRRVPFKLPIKLERSLIKFMKYVKLDSGSIDMIYSTDNKYYFLEVNPVGQFGMVSKPCNYNLEKLIAKSLMR